MQVIKRNGKKQPVNFNKILIRLQKASIGLKVDSVELSKEVIQGLFDGVTSIELDNLAAEVSASKVIQHHDYSKLAANLSISRLHKETKPFKETFLKLKKIGYLNKEYSLKVKDYTYEKIEEIIDYNKDYNFEYFGFKTLEKSYLLKDLEGNVVERPQHMYIRVALTVTDNFDDFKKYYNLLSNQLISPATPIMYNSGTVNEQLSSCVLISNKGDSLEGICETYTDVARTSADAAGIGLDLSNIRSKQSKIMTSNGQAAGWLRQYKVYNELSLTYNQQGKRKGSFAMFAPLYHKDILDVIDVRKNHGKEELRARHLFTALWVSDLFMKRLMNKEKWTLFCPNDIVKNGGTPLEEVYGEEFERLYEQYENDPKFNGVETNITELWKKVIENQIETGTPYILFKDNINRKSNHKNYGTIRQSNLCAEIVQYTDKYTTANCTLSSIPVQKYIFDGNKYDFEKLFNSVYEITKTLNIVIDKNKYSTKEGRKGGLQQRAIAIGIQGLANLFCELDLPFTSDEAKILDSNIAETLYYASLKASNDLAKKIGKTYDGFENSPASKGILQYDMWNETNPDNFFDETQSRWDWKKLKRDIQEYGLYNSLTVGYMPTASSAQIIGSNECFEPFTSNIYVRRVNASEFIVINKHLVEDLEKIGLWDDKVGQLIAYNGGSVNTIDSNIEKLEEKELIQNLINKIPEDIREKYKTVWEISQKEIINMAANRGRFIDQSQSMNLFVEKPSTNLSNKMLFYGWKKGLKTGMYYLRSKAAKSALKSLGIDIKNFNIDKTSNNQQNNEEEILACSIEAMKNGEDCEMCGS